MTRLASANAKGGAISEQRSLTTGNILPRVAAGEADAFRECIEAYGGLIWSLVRRRLRNRAAAEDAVQDIFLELWRKAGAYHPELGSEITFVGMISRRRLIDNYRREARTVPTEPVNDSFDDCLPDQADTTKLAELHEEAQRASQAMQQLPAMQQTVLRLSIFDGLSYPEIAQRLSIPLGTVKTHARRGLIRLREILQISHQTADVEVELVE
jgi:RNA polymerase sigma factor (sigma-70 family)